MTSIQSIIRYSFLVMALFAMNLAFAQRGHHGKQHHGKHHEKMIEVLKAEGNLTADQEAQIKAIQEKYKPQIQALRQQETDNPAEKREAIHRLMKAQKDEVGQVLTEEQRALLKAKRAEHKAQKRERMEKVDKKALHEELKNYKAQNIEPVMLQQRAKLEKEISAEDKATIAELRTTFDQLKADKKAKKQEMKKAGERPDHETRKAHHEAIKEKYQSEFETLDALTEKYDAQIQALMKEIEPKHQQWKEDMHNIHKKYMPAPAEGEAHPHAKDGYAHKKRKGKKHHGKRHKEGKGKKHHSHFLLLDPNAAPAPTMSSGMASTTLKAFPNPTSEVNTLTYNVQEAGLVKIILTDESGNLIKTLVDEYKTIGEYQMEVNLADLKTGAYYYTVSDKSGVKSEKVVVSRQ